MISRVKKKITNRISNILRGIVRNEIENVLPILPQLTEFQNSAKEDRQSFYDHTKDPLESISFHEGLKDRLISTGVPVDSISIDIHDFERWLNDFPEIRRHYVKMGDVFMEKCLEHYLAFKHLNISSGDIYIDIASSGSPWAGILNKRGRGKTAVRGQKFEVRERRKAQKGLRAYRLDLSFPKGINGTDIGADAGDTKLPNGFASVLSLQCAYECFMGDADIDFIKEANRILNENGRYGIAPLYLADIHFVSTSPYCNQAEVIIEPEARKVWRDDEYREPFSRHYSPESFAERIVSMIPCGMVGKILFFKNLADMMRHYTGQRIYCFFMFQCEKKEGSP